MLLLAVLPLLLSLLVVALLFYNQHFKRRNLPPGPTPWPLLGNLPILLKEMPEQCFLRWERQYGSVFTIWMGMVPVVCVTDYATIMDTFQRDGDAYAGRYSFELDYLLRGGAFGVFFTEGKLWREQRRFAVHVLRDFGMGKNLMQEKILSEMELMFDRINREIGSSEAEKDNNKEVNIGQLLGISVGSIINNLLFGYCFDDERLGEFFKLKRLVREIFEDYYHPLQVLFSWHPDKLRRLPLFSSIYRGMEEHIVNLYSFFRQQIKEHLEEIDLDDFESPPRDLVEVFLKEKAKRDARGEHEYTINQLLGLCEDLWTGGQETSATTLTWGFAYLIRWPDVQARVHAEIDRVIGGDNKERLITVSDRAALHYTNATINETQRLSNLVPINSMHKLTRDVVINGYRLPKGCVITPQISAVMANREIFENPNEFRPERFLDEEGKLKRVDELIPFSIGKRQCPGEPLARMELFLFLANLLHKYKFSCGKVAPSLERKLGATAMCPEYKCRIEKRCANVVAQS